jgi:hypothetical protein
MECALWSTSDTTRTTISVHEGRMLDRSYDVSDIPSDAQGWRQAVMAFAQLILTI